MNSCLYKRQIFISFPGNPISQNRMTFCPPGYGLNQSYAENIRPWIHADIIQILDQSIPTYCVLCGAGYYSLGGNGASCQMCTDAPPHSSYLNCTGGCSSVDCPYVCDSGYSNADCSSFSNSLTSPSTMNFDYVDAFMQI